MRNQVHLFVDIRMRMHAEMMLQQADWYHQRKLTTPIRIDSLAEIGAMRRIQVIFQITEQMLQYIGPGMGGAGRYLCLAT